MKKLLVNLLAFSIILLIGYSGFTESDAQIDKTSGIDYWPPGTSDANCRQKVIHFDIKAASAEIRTITVEIKGYNWGTLQIASGHPGAATASTSGSMEAGCYVWAECKPGTSRDIVEMASMYTNRTDSSGMITRTTAPIEVKGNYDFDTGGNSWMILRMIGNSTTDKQLTLSLIK